MDNVFPLRQLPVVQVGGLVDRCRLTLGIHGEKLDPDEVTRMLGCIPTRAHRRGDSRRVGPPWPRGAWLLSVDAAFPDGPEELVRRLLDRLPSDPELWAALRAQFVVRLSFGIFINAWNRGFELSADAVARVSALGLGIGFDLYATGEEVEPSTPPTRHSRE